MGQTFSTDVYSSTPALVSQNSGAARSVVGGSGGSVDIRIFDLKSITTSKANATRSAPGTVPDYVMVYIYVGTPGSTNSVEAYVDDTPAAVAAVAAARTPLADDAAGVDFSTDRTGCYWIATGGHGFLALRVSLDESEVVAYRIMNL